MRRPAAVAAVCLVLVGVVFVAHHVSSGGSSPSRADASRHPAATPSAQRIRWRNVAGIRVPVSETNGPTQLADGHAGGYSRTAEGAAIAAVQLLVRTSASAGSNVFEPILETQVAGPAQVWFRDALARQYDRQRRQLGAPVADGDPLPGNDATVLGYRAVETTDAEATVDVLLTSPQLPGAQVLAVTVDLQWDGDWRLVPPPDADWGAVTQLLPSVPAWMRSYEELG